MARGRDGAQPAGRRHRRLARAACAGVAWLGLFLARGVAAQEPAEANPNPMDSIRRLPGYRPAADTTHYLAPARIAALPVTERAAWEAYLARSRRRHALDTAAMNAELRATGRTEMIRAPYAHGFEVDEATMTPAWLAGDSARRVAEIVLSFQAPNGGWSKHVDMYGHSRRPGESYFGESAKWQWISTIDNGATTSEMEFLAMVDRARPDARYRAAFVRGVAYLLEAQAPNGCWPQVYPLEGSYHDAATFNDDATMHAARLLRAVARGDYPFVPAAERQRAAGAVSRVVECVLRAQVVVDGRRTVWGQQHDPLTLQPVPARSYELTSLTAQESATILRFLMELTSPDARVVAAVHDAADWFRAARLHDYTYDFTAGRRDAPGAGPLWARMYEIGTNRPIFSNREGIRLYDYTKLTDRAHGYAWYTYAPVAVLREYERWAAAHPR